MRKRILGILTAVLALSMVFTMVNCDSGGGGGSTYTIKYDKNDWAGGGFPIADVKIQKNAAIGAANLPNLESTPTQIFKGWAPKKTDTTPIGVDYTVASNITLFVICEAPAPVGTAATIAYDANGWKGAAVPSATTGVVGTAYTAAQLPTRAHTDTQIFLGWAETPTGDVLTAGVDAPKVATVTLYVIWQGTSATDTTPIVTGVAVTPASVAVEQGKTQQFAAAVTGLNLKDTDKTVTWSVSGGGAGTSISSTGLLTVAAAEAATSLTVRAASTVTSAVTGAATVTVVAAGTPYVSAITIDPATATLAPGDTKQFEADVVAHNGAAETVIWTVEGNNAATTTISDAGLLTVAAAETATALTVKATSTVTTTVSGTAAVTVTQTVDTDLTISFIPWADYAGAPITLKIGVDVKIGDSGKSIPAGPARPGYIFAYWTYGGIEVTDDTSFAVADIPVEGYYIVDALTADTDAEVVYLENGSSAIFQFNIPAGKSLANYESISFDVKVSAATIYLWGKGGIHSTRVYGVFTPNAETVSTDAEHNYLNFNDYRGRYLLSTGPASADIQSLAEAAGGADKWFTITESFTGSRGGDFSADHAPDATKTGTVFLGIGIGSQASSGQGVNQEQQFVELIKNVKLVGAGGEADLAGARPVKPTPVFPNPSYEVPDFVSYKDPIVFAWRATATQDNINNWKTLSPKRGEVSGGDRGDPPAIASLIKVPLHTDSSAFTYLRLASAGNYDNQRGWVCFEEANRADSKDPAAPASVVQFADFKEAWYLEVVAAQKPTGTLNLVWMGNAAGWLQNAATSNVGAALEGVSTIEEVDGKWVLRFLLPKALGDYGEYYDENTWAGLAFSYWGASNHNLADMDITEAYLLVESPAGFVTQGLGFAYTFTLGAAPAGGNIITDVKFDGDVNSGALVVTGVDTADTYRWYVDGALQVGQTTDTLTYGTSLTGGTKISVTLEAKTGSLWKSQSVYITLKD